MLKYVQKIVHFNPEFSYHSAGAEEHGRGRVKVLHAKSLYSPFVVC